LKLEFDQLLSNFAFKCNLRRYITGNDTVDILGLASGGAVQADPRLTLLAFNA